MQLARKKRFRRQYDDGNEYDRDSKNDSAKILSQPEFTTIGNDDDVSDRPDQYQSLKSEIPGAPSPTPSLSEQLNYKSNDDRCGMFCDFFLLIKLPFFKLIYMPLIRLFAECRTNNNCPAGPPGPKGPPGHKGTNKGPLYFVEKF